MAERVLRVRGRADADTAWRRYADLDEWSRWSPQIRRVDVTGGGGRRLSTGLRGRVVPLLGPAVPFEVLDVDEAARVWSWVVRLGPFRLRLDHAVESVEPRADGCATSLCLAGPRVVVLGYAPLARLALGRLVRA